MQHIGLWILRVSTSFAFAGGGFPGGTVVKNLPASAGDIRDRGLVTGGDDPLEEGTATHSSILVWRFLWIGEPERLQSVGLQRVRHN